MSIKTTVQKYLSERAHKVGETVQYGWFVFRIAEINQPPRIETLDFQRMASYTEDFSEVERIHNLQNAALAEYDVCESPSTLCQSALVSRSYFPGREDAYIERQETASDNDSGWYIGVLNEHLDMEDPSSFTNQSLYELTINDMRMAPYWLLPPGIVIQLEFQPDNNDIP